MSAPRVHATIAGGTVSARACRATAVSVAVLLMPRRPSCVMSSRRASVVMAVDEIARARANAMGAPIKSGDSEVPCPPVAETAAPGGRSAIHSPAGALCQPAGTDWGAAVVITVVGPDAVAAFVLSIR